MNIHFNISDSFKRSKELELFLTTKKGDEITMSKREYKCLRLLYSQYRKISNLGYWAGIIEQCQNSGKPIKSWCKEAGISSSKYYYWRRKLQHDLPELLVNVNKET